MKQPRVQKYHDTHNGWTVVFSIGIKKYVDGAIGGLGYILSPRALKSQKSIERIESRMMWVSFNGNVSTTIDYCNSPNNASEGTDSIMFLTKLSGVGTCIYDE